VHSPSYDGPDRRAEGRDYGRRHEDVLHDVVRHSLKWLIPVSALVGGIFAAGTSYGLTKASLDGKQDRAPQSFVDSAQNRAIEILGRGQAAIIIKQDSTNLRLRQMWCEGKGSSCR
jgi:hypothetical protein